jgi:hypothetical protein
MLNQFVERDVSFVYVKTIARVGVAHFGL